MLRRGDKGEVIPPMPNNGAPPTFTLVGGCTATDGAARNPGAGMDLEAIEPYDQVYKDGFWHVGCYYDTLRVFGDKHSGQGQARYKTTAGVSIIWYNEMVADEDRDSMTPEVCFDFCATVPDMHFFGLVHGRDCYCGPYYDAGAGGEGDCDQVCEGDTSAFCGGKDKSDIYQMHTCPEEEEE